MPGYRPSMPTEATSPLSPTYLFVRSQAQIRPTSTLINRMETTNNKEKRSESKLTHRSGTDAPAHTTTTTIQQDKDNPRIPQRNDDDNDPYLVDWNGDKDPDNPLTGPCHAKPSSPASSVSSPSPSTGLSHLLPQESRTRSGLLWSRNRARHSRLDAFCYRLRIGADDRSFKCFRDPRHRPKLTYLFTLFIFVILQIPTALVNTKQGS